MCIVVVFRMSMCHCLSYFQWKTLYILPYIYICMSVYMCIYVHIGKTINNSDKELEDTLHTAGQMLQCHSEIDL